jgi:hypothetical protein
MPYVDTLSQCVPEIYRCNQLITQNSPKSHCSLFYWTNMIGKVLVIDRHIQSFVSTIYMHRFAIRSFLNKKTSTPFFE